MKGRPVCSVTMLLSAKLRRKISLGAGAVAVKFIMNRWRTSWFEFARSSARA